jgi:hypothetical protein
MKIFRLQLKNHIKFFKLYEQTHFRKINPLTKNIFTLRRKGMIIKENIRRTFLIACASIIFTMPFTTTEETANAGAAAKTLDPGSTWVINETTKLSSLTIPDGTKITAPEGYRVTMTVDGVETGQVLEKWSGVDYKFAPGSYNGDIVLTVSKANDVAWSMTGGGMPEGASGSAPGGAGGPGSGSISVYPFRQALYLDKGGIDYDKSVMAAVQGEKPSGFDIKNIRIESKGTFYKDSASLGGTGFNGIYVAGGEYHLKNIKIDFAGDGRSDFAAQGTAIVASGKGAKLILDNSIINTRGVVRSGVIAKDQSNLIVKNSKINVKNGVLPPDWLSPMDTSQMRSTLWISGMTGTTRATSILGNGTQATYINTSISFEGWGGLSTDIGNKSKLTTINCKIDNTGNSGYGQYNNSNAITRILGCEFNIATIGLGSDSGSVSVGDSTREAVEALNKELSLGLTAEELKSIPVKSTIINSGFQGVLWHGTGCALTINGGTIINSKDTMFVDKGAYTDIQVDGSRGARLDPGNGIIMQVMDDDEPPRDSSKENKTGGFGEYEEPTGPSKKDDSHDVYTAKNTDALARFSNINLKGNFYNSARGGQKNNPMAGGMINCSKNLGLTLNNSQFTGVISSSDASHYFNGKYYPKIGVKDMTVFNRVINTPGQAVNNGVIVTLTNGSTWTVTGTSYLTRLVIEKGSSIAAPPGHTLTMTVDGTPVSIMNAGEHRGNISITVK